MALRRGLRGALLAMIEGQVRGSPTFVGVRKVETRVLKYGVILHFPTPA